MVPNDKQRRGYLPSSTASLMIPRKLHIHEKKETFGHLDNKWCGVRVVCGVHEVSSTTLQRRSKVGKKGSLYIFIPCFITVSLFVMIHTASKRQFPATHIEPQNAVEPGRRAA